MEQYVYNSCYWDTFEYSFFVMLYTCILCIKEINVLVCVIELILYFFPFCSMLVYNRYIDAKINPLRVETPRNILPSKSIRIVCADDKIPFFELATVMYYGKIDSQQYCDCVGVCSC